MRDRSVEISSLVEQYRLERALWLEVGPLIMVLTGPTITALRRFIRQGREMKMYEFQSSV